jgi:hypothetical protein
MNIQQYLWLVPFFFAVHNLEEVYSMKKWPRKTSLPFQVEVKNNQFVIAVSILTAFVFIITFWGINQTKYDFGIAVILAIQAIVFINSIFPHIFVALLHRKYNPGLATSIFINIPFSVYLFRQALVEKILELDEMLIMLAIAPLAMIILIRGSLKAAELLQSR